MANEEHVKMLDQGVEAWNKWRRENPDIQPDLRGANLIGADLSKADLSRASLNRADLSRADLRGVNLIRADLSGVNLSGADLSGANLRGANLRGANLSGASLFRANFLRANFFRANLSGADLRAVNLGGVDLSRADLSGANLGNADLSGADLSKADFSGADLFRANLSGADLSRADFSGADLSRANLSGTDLSRANLSGADLDNARVGWSTLGNVDLSMAKGLDTVIHLGPSAIGIDTIYRSKGNIPEVFLRGAGVPDSFIEYMASLVGKPIQFYSCFISHSGKDERFCGRLYADLQTKGVRTWYFPEDTRWGGPVWGEIDHSIRIYDKLVVICSGDSLQSGPVLREIELALQREDRGGKNVLFLVRIDDYLFDRWEHPRKADVVSKVVGDFRGWDQDTARYDVAFRKLLRALEAE